MRDENMIARNRQLTIRREMDRRGVSLKGVALDSRISYATIVSWFPARADMDPPAAPIAALHRFCDTEALPLDLLSLFLPDGFAIVKVPEGLDHDRLAEGVAEYLALKNKFHGPNTEAGTAIGPNEDSALTDKIVQIVGVR